MIFLKSRSVLILADEGLQVFYVSSSFSRQVAFIPWDVEDFMLQLRTALVTKCNKASVVILNDMVEQQYRKEIVPKASFFDQSSILKRRLSIAFPNYQIRSALKLLDKSAFSKNEEKGYPYLFAAMPSSPSFKKVLTVISSIGLHLKGVYLLPVESSMMIKALSQKLHKSNQYKPKWTIFIGQHHAGNLRQVVTRNNELALTRLTPIVDTDVEPDLWSRELANELLSTMSYLSRFGYQESDGLDIIIVANNICEDQLRQVINLEANIHVLSSEKMGGMLGLKIGRQEDYRYADVIHAAFLGNRSQYILPMEAEQIKSITEPKKIAGFLFVICILAYIAFLYLTFKDWNAYLLDNDQLYISRERVQSLKQEYRREAEKQKAIGFDFILVNNALEIYDDIKVRKLDLIPVLTRINAAINRGVHIDDVVIKVDEAKKEPVFDEYGGIVEEGKDKAYFLNAVATLSFPDTVSPDVGVRKVEEFKQRLETEFPEFDVEIIKQIAGLSYTGNFTGSAGDNSVAGEAVTEEDLKAEIQIRGLLNAE